MAILIFLIIALLVAAGLIALNVRASTPRNRDSGTLDRTELPESIVIARDDGTEAGDEPSRPAVQLESGEPEVHAESQDADSPRTVTRLRDDNKMNDFDYRQALQNMKSQVAQDAEPIRNIKSEEVMNDNAFRDSLKAFSQKEKK
ncbi:hypothetical protein [Bacillus sp. V5-8f]|uniref:hypothetical protein n=1 Tax=Bacillus sp. V5-8f TaxID=2053044 RepID=UPI000C76B3CE|nr:hypothetical protein [Bacillus sp. V5-8f]PLT33018.1 hypothetical protein CUU64_16430 [Bacillus sp. V5-8f]